MITSLVTSLFRVTLTWYLLGMLVLFLGDPIWAESAYKRLSELPGVPVFKMLGLSTAFKVQAHLLMYWTVPLMLMWALSIAAGASLAKIQVIFRKKEIVTDLRPRGNFWGVTIPKYSLGRLPPATTPQLSGQPVRFSEGFSLSKSSDITWVDVKGAVKDSLGYLDTAERELAEELLQLLAASPNHFAGLGHGVGLLEHTLNVLSEAAPKCSPDFRLPFLAALAHDIGKLVTFQPDGKGGWNKKGLHSRECARILATLPAFQKLPSLHQDALILAVKYDHAPSKMPLLRGEKESSLLALRIIKALSAADRSATAGEKERNLEKLNPEDLLWLDFVKSLRDAPVVQQGKAGSKYQINYPDNSEFVFIYESSWRDAAIERIPPEVAAALDLTRRDKGQVAKYTKILLERLAKEGLLLTEYTVTSTINGEHQTVHHKASPNNPLWDIQSGKGEKAAVIRGVIALKAEPLWKVLNYKLGNKSPYAVQILAPNANANGSINEAPERQLDAAPSATELSTSLKIDANSPEDQATYGFGETGPARGKTRSRYVESTIKQKVVGLAPDTANSAPTTPIRPVKETKEVTDSKDIATTYSDTERTQSTPEENTKNKPDNTENAAIDVALAYLTETSGESTTPRLDNSPKPERPTRTLETARVSKVRPDSEPVQTKKSVATYERNHEKDKTPTPTQPRPNNSVALGSLSRAEQKYGIGLADSEVCSKYPHLTVGEKYYTENAKKVIEGAILAGTKYVDRFQKAESELNTQKQNPVIVPRANYTENPAVAEPKLAKEANIIVKSNNYSDPKKHAKNPAATEVNSGVGPRRRANFK